MRIQKTMIIGLLIAIMTIGHTAPAHARNYGLEMVAGTAILGAGLGYLAFSGKSPASGIASGVGKTILAGMAGVAVLGVTHQLLNSNSSHHTMAAPSYYGTQSYAYVPQYYVAVPRDTYQRYGN